LGIGDYVRTDKGEIGKVSSVMKENLGFGDIEVCNTEPYVYGTIIKSRPNIIDLIAKNDLLKIIYPIGREKDLFQEEITQVIENEDNKLYIKLYTEQYVFLEDLSRYDIKIKSVLTKEMFEQMEYKVESEVN